MKTTKPTSSELRTYLKTAQSSFTKSELQVLVRKVNR